MEECIFSQISFSRGTWSIRKLQSTCDIEYPVIQIVLYKTIFTYRSSYGYILKKYEREIKKNAKVKGYSNMAEMFKIVFSPNKLTLRI